MYGRTVFDFYVYSDYLRFLRADVYLYSDYLRFLRADAYVYSDYLRLVFLLAAMRCASLPALLPPVILLHSAGGVCVVPLHPRWVHVRQSPRDPPPLQLRSGRSPELSY